VSKRRTWRKLHLGVDEATGEILGAVATTNDFHDGEVLKDVLEAIPEPIGQVSTDGAYDHRHCYDEIAAKGAKAVIPPRKDAVIWQEGKDTPHPRDENLRSIRQSRFVSMDVNAGSAILAIIVGRLLKLPCFVSKQFLAAI
jgi:hypothetical protein